MKQLRVLPALAAFFALACGSDEPTPSAATGEKPAITLTLGAYTTPREAYGTAIIPAFVTYWKEKAGQDVTFEESYQASGAQARAVLEGFEADVVALSLEPDIKKLEDASLVAPTWRHAAHGGMVSDSIAVIAVRPGNPKGIHDWADLARPDVEVLTPNVRTSGGAMWNVLAIYGAATRGHVAGVPKDDPAAAEAFLAKVIQRVKVMDKGARESITTFESGVGDAAITYENEVIVARLAGQTMDYVVPSSTILIENPAAVVDGYAKKRGTEEVAKGFVEFLHGTEAQTAFAKYGQRPVDPSVATDLPPVSDLFTVADLGGWSGVAASVFDKGAGYDRAAALAEGR